ncbi:SusC/RagA family TonB-linked outer membrane protein [Hyunsoonleella sp. 2307UL5-6]|uniref:SusC/RagA family TonB-linked outer membrane protein n=1 Tax=Hyunsoonleella sp. 2307UL5-6 TaxID=3384768 RepID=UPI0039BC90D8
MKIRLLWILTVFLSLTTQLSMAQEKTVSGTIIDQTGLPMTGVTVQVAGTNRGVISDFDGNYAIKANQGEVLQFSYVGMKTAQITVGSSTTVNVTMQEDLEALDTVVITGYQNIAREVFTGASQSVKAKDIELAGLPDITQSLEGRAAGVSVQNVTGTFGAAPRITIRGSASILGNADPIWIVDGVIQEQIVNVSFADLVSGDPNTLLSSAIAGLNANDIESFEILRDASATSLYGARAQNGVIVITTKSGGADQAPTFSYNGDFLMRDRPRYAQFNLLNSQETVSIYNELESKGFLQFPDVLFGRNGGIYNIRANAINDFSESNGAFGIPNTDEARASFLQQFELANTDWFKELYNMTPTQNHNISFSSGSKTTRTYASLGYFTDGGWTIADRVRRVTANYRNSFHFNDDKLVFTLLGSANVVNQKAPGTLARQNDTFFGAFNREFDLNPFNYSLTTSRALRPRDGNGDLEFYRANWAPINILNEVENNSLEINRTDIKFQGQIKYELNDKLTYNFLGSARFVQNIGENSARESSNRVSAYRAAENAIVRNANTFLFNDPDNPVALPRVVLPVGGILTETKNTLTAYTFRNSLQYDNTFNDVHNLNVYFNQEYRHADRSSSSFTGYGYQFDRGGAIFTDPGILTKDILEGNDYFFSQDTRSREVSLAMQVNYDFDRKYVLSVTGNYEGSNRAGESSSSRWLPTYSIGGRWNVHKESFLQDSDVISSLVFRPSYGVTGLLNDAASNNRAIFLNEITDRFNLDDRENFINISDLQNSELTYEQTRELNLGLEVGFFNERIRAIFDVYSRRGIDLLDFVRTSGIGGQSVKLGNNAEMTTNGIEFQLNSVNVNTSDFQWRSGFNISFIEQEITSLQQRPNVFSLVNGTGNAIGTERNALYSFDFAGLNEFGVPTFNLGEDVDPISGIDFQATEDILDFLVYEGPSLPTITGGLANNFNYKNWNFSFFMSFSAGNKIRLDPSYSSVYTDLSVFPREFVNRWQQPGDENITDIPAIASRSLIESVGNTAITRAYNAYNFSTARVADGDFIRMKNISIGYTFNGNAVKNIGLSSLRLNLQGTNLFLLYSDDKLGGQDPEFFNSGGVASPITRSYTFTLNVGF